MLTESELAWLIQRNPRGKVGDMFFSCHNCDEADKTQDVPSTRRAATDAKYTKRTNMSCRTPWSSVSE